MAALPSDPSRDYLPAWQTAANPRHGRPLLPSDPVMSPSCTASDPQHPPSAAVRPRTPANLSGSTPHSPVPSPLIADPIGHPPSLRWIRAYRSHRQSLVRLPAISLSSGAQVSGRSAKTSAAVNTTSSNATVSSSRPRHNLVAPCEVHAGGFTRSAGGVCYGGLAVPFGLAWRPGIRHGLAGLSGALGQDVRVGLQVRYLLVELQVLGRSDVSQGRVIGGLRCWRRLIGGYCDGGGGG